MQYGTIYTMSWLTAQEDVTVTVNIFDTENLIDDAASPVIYNLTATGKPCVISVIDNNREKWGIKAKQAKLEFYSEPGVNAWTFAESNDQRWLVEIKTDLGEMIFTGFIVLTDITRPFMPDKQVITLTATDGLGLLKEKPFKIGGATPTGKMNLAQILHYCLVQTGLNLELAVHENIRPYYYGFLDYTNHLYTKMGVDLKTFETQIGECEDCYTIIGKILDKDCFLFQYKNRWWIMRPDDFDGNPAYITYFNLSATQYDYDTFDNSRNLGLGADNFWLNAAQMVEYERPYKFAKHTFNFDSPQEIICNTAFERGALLTTVSSTKKRYVLNCWTIKQGIGAGTASPLITPYIERIFDSNNYEKQRYAVLPCPPNTQTALHYIESEPIELQEKDRFTFSVDYAWGTNASSGGVYSQSVATIRLEAEDGTKWTLDDDGTWYQSNATWGSNFKYLSEVFVPDNIDEQEFRSKSVDAKDCPRNGKIYIMLYALNQQGASSVDDTEIHFNNLLFDYQPFINGSYARYRGQYSKVYRDNYSANLDQQVSISDSPKETLKGGLFYYINSEDGWVLHTQGYFNATPHGNGDPPNTDYVHPFEYIRVYSTFNQYRRGIRYFTGDVYGLGQDWPDLYHKWAITDMDYDSNNRRFQLLSFEQDWKSCQWRGVFSEVWHTEGKVYDDPFEFKYIN